MNIRSIQIVFIILMTLSLAPDLNGQRVATFISEGDHAMKLGNWISAINMYSTAIDIDNTSAKAYIKRARVYEITGNADLAKKDYDRALFYNPFAGVYYLGKARMELMAKNYFGANEDLNFLPFIDGVGSFSSSFHLTERMMMDRYQDAFNNLDLKLRVAEDDEQLYLRDALLLFNRGDYAEAMTLIAEMKEREMYSSLLHDIEGLIFLQNEGYDDAREAFTLAITKEPHYSQAFQNRAYTYLKSGNLLMALMDYDQVIALDPGQSELFFQRGLVYLQMGRFDAALEDFNTARNADPSFEEAHYNWIFCLMMTGNYTEAYFQINNSMIENPRDPSSFYLRGCLYFIYGDYTKAISDFTYYLDFYPGDPLGTFNKALAYILKNQVVTGCDELEVSTRRGFSFAEEVHLAFCR